MKKLLVTIAIMMLLSLQGCYVDYGPGPPAGYGENAGYEPPPIAFEAPPDVIVMPYASDVYVVPDINIDLFFWNGWWWRPWEGRWYRSQYYNRGWGYYNGVPSFYYNVDPGWRGYYREQNWHGNRWNYERIPNQRLQQNWKNWHNDKHWEKEKSWGVQGLKPGSQRPEAQPGRDYRPQRPEVQPGRDYRPQRPEVQPGRDYRSQHPEGQPVHDPRSQRPEAQPGRDPRSQRPEAQPGRDFRSQHPEGQSGRDLRPQSREDKSAQGMKSKPQEKHQTKDANQREKQEKETVEKQDR